MNSTLLIEVLIASFPLPTSELPSYPTLLPTPHINLAAPPTSPRGCLLLPRQALSPYQSVATLLLSTHCAKLTDTCFAQPHLMTLGGFPGGTVVKNLPASAGPAVDMGSVSGSGRSPGGGNSNPSQYSCWDYPRGWTEEPGGLYSPWGCRVRHD